MTPAALYSGARKAVRLACECDREADLPSSLMPSDHRIWKAYMLSEARRHRERAAWYLRSRKWQLNDEVHNDSP